LKEKKIAQRKKTYLILVLEVFWDGQISGLVDLESKIPIAINFFI
jgi:hypothetical protein